MTEEPEASDLTIDISVEDDAWLAAWPDSRAVVLRASRLALGHAAARPACAGYAEVSVVLAGDAQVRRLNRIYRGRDSATNVLSFAYRAPGGSASGGPDPARGACLGDVVLARETIEREAREQGKAPGDHLAHLVVHGLLHLCGFDHEGEAEALGMERLERELLAGLGIADPYRDGRDAERPP